MAVSIEIIVTGIEDLVERLDPKDHRRRLMQIGNRIGNMVRGALQQHTPKKSGFLASQYFDEVSQQGNDIVIRVFNPVPYGSYVNLGTGIFVGRDFIRPTRSKVLRFEAGGQILYRRFVRGQRGQFFVQRALQAVQGDLQRTTSIGIQAELDGR